MSFLVFSLATVTWVWMSRGRTGCFTSQCCLTYTSCLTRRWFICHSLNIFCWILNQAGGYKCVYCVFLYAFVCTHWAVREITFGLAYPPAPPTDTLQWAGGWKRTRVDLTTRLRPCLETLSDWAQFVSLSCAFSSSLSLFSSLALSLVSGPVFLYLACSLSGLCVFVSLSVSVFSVCFVSISLSLFLIFESSLPNQINLLYRPLWRCLQICLTNRHNVLLCCWLAKREWQKWWT